MENFSEYSGVLVTFLLATAIACLIIFLNGLLGPKNKSTPAKLEPFECGVKPFGLPGGQMPVHFYIVAMLFIIFDVEMVFLFPWAVLFRKLGIFGLVEMAVFMGFVVLGFWYVWKKRALEWE